MHSSLCSGYDLPFHTAFIKALFHIFFSIAGQLGDLIESVHEVCLVSGGSNCCPGHGGVLVLWLLAVSLLCTSLWLILRKGEQILNVRIINLYPCFWNYRGGSQFGHFYFAKSGITVQWIAIGMGPKILPISGKTGTAYTIHLYRLVSLCRITGWGWGIPKKLRQEYCVDMTEDGGVKAHQSFWRRSTGGSFYAGSSLTWDDSYHRILVVWRRKKHSP